MPFTFVATAIPEVKVVRPQVFQDARGWFLESYKRSDFEGEGIRGPFDQDNHSMSLAAGVLRGIHYQLPPFDQGKLVRVTRGAVVDVAVDLRPGSPTYRQWVAQELTAENRQILWVPPGFGHAFCTLVPGTEVLYKTTSEYRPQLDRCIRWDDPDLAVAWPTPNPVLSPKDAAAPALAAAEPELRRAYEGA